MWVEGPKRLALIGALVLMAAACTGSDADTESTTAPSGSQATSTTPAPPASSTTSSMATTTSTSPPATSTTAPPPAPETMTAAEYLAALNEINADLTIAQSEVTAALGSPEQITDVIVDALRTLRGLDPPSQLAEVHDAFDELFADLALAGQQLTRALADGVPLETALDEYLSSFAEIGDRAIAADLALVEATAPVLTAMDDPIALFLAELQQIQIDGGGLTDEIFEVFGSIVDDPIGALDDLVDLSDQLAMAQEEWVDLQPPPEVAYLLERQIDFGNTFLSILEQVATEIEEQGEPSLLTALEMQSLGDDGPLINAGWAYLLADVLRGERRPLSGNVVLVSAETAGPDDGAAMVMALAPFEEESGVRIVFRPVSDLVASLDSAPVAGGAAPDIAIFDTAADIPGLAGIPLRPLPDSVVQTVAEMWPEGWIDVGSHDGVPYGVPTSSVVTALIWYSAPAFAEAGYAPPETWQDLLDLVATMAADDRIPWCLSLDEGGSPGRLLLDWAEQSLLRNESGDTYDRWTTHAIAFDDERVAGAWADALEIIDAARSGDVVGGTAAGTTQEGATDLRLGDCMMLPADSSTFEAFPDAIVLGEEGIDVTPVPGVRPGEYTATVDGAFATALRPGTEIEAVLIYLASPEFAVERQIALTSLVGRPNPFLSASLDQRLVPYSDIEARLIGILQNTSTVRQDSLRLWPIDVGIMIVRQAGEVIAGSQQIADALGEVESAWLRYESSLFDIDDGLTACVGGDLVACDLVFLLAPDGSAAEAIGFDCGGAEANEGASCSGFTGDPPPQEPGDDALLDALLALCEPGNADACIWLGRLSAPGSEYERLADELRFGLFD